MHLLCETQPISCLVCAALKSTSEQEKTHRAKSKLLLKMLQIVLKVVGTTEWKAKGEFVV
jgi:hypothetical protein